MIKKSCHFFLEECRREHSTIALYRSRLSATINLLLTLGQFGPCRRSILETWRQMWQKTDKPLAPEVLIVIIARLAG
ncbi:hypothetical protein [Shewanella atlantica]|uniref:hypothetical protein n=1 Tax=Shewanella atlantica TaxID=271099 RepID=UPI003736BD04